MNTSLMQQLEQHFVQLQGGLPSPATPGSVFDDPDQFETLKVALIVKYGPNVRESAFKFVEEVEAIMAKHAAKTGGNTSTLPQRLDALKESVGEETYNKLLVNPEIERMAARAYRRANEARSSQALNEISALFNNAIGIEELAYLLNALSNVPDPVGLLSNV